MLHIHSALPQGFHAAGCVPELEESCCSQDVVSSCDHSLGAPGGGFVLMSFPGT